MEEQQPGEVPIAGAETQVPNENHNGGSEKEEKSPQDVARQKRQFVFLKIFSSTQKSRAVSNDLVLNF